MTKKAEAPPWIMILWLLGGIWILGQALYTSPYITALWAVMTAVLVTQEINARKK
jgi:hypothetical protein